MYTIVIYKMYILLCHVLTETWTTQINSTLKIQNFIMIRNNMMTFSNMYLLHILQQHPSSVLPLPLALSTLFFSVQQPRSVQSTHSRLSWRQRQHIGTMRTLRTHIHLTRTITYTRKQISLPHTALTHSELHNTTSLAPPITFCFSF